MERKKRSTLDWVMTAIIFTAVVTAIIFTAVVAGLIGYFAGLRDAGNLINRMVAVEPGQGSVITKALMWNPGTNTYDTVGMWCKDIGQGLRVCDEYNDSWVGQRCQLVETCD